MQALKLSGHFTYPVSLAWPTLAKKEEGLVKCLYYARTSLHEDPQFSCPRGSESRTRKLRLHYGDFVQANSKMADSTAGQLESALRINKASAKAFEPTNTRTYCILGEL